MRVLFLVATILFPVSASAEQIKPCHTPKECQAAVHEDLSFIDKPGFWADHRASRDGLSRVCAEKKPGWETYARACQSMKQQR